jgi:hypothetical protein
MTVLYKLGFFLALAVVAIAAAAVVLLPMIAKFRAETDLQDYACAVRKAALPLTDKEYLLDVIERLEDRVNGEQQVRWLNWSQHNNSIREMLRSGIDGNAAPLIRRELLRVEKHLAEGN